MKIVSFIVTFFLIYIPANIYCQPLNYKTLQDSIATINKNTVVTLKDKLIQFYNIKEFIEKHDLTNDTLYISVLVQISKYEYVVNQNISTSISYLNQALAINKRLSTKSSNQLNIVICYSLGYYFQQQNFYSQALIYYDSTGFFCSKINYDNFFKKYSLVNKVTIYLAVGDYQKAIDDCNVGIIYTKQFRDTANYIFFVNRKAWASYHTSNMNEASAIANTALAYATKNKDSFELNLSYKTKALTCKSFGDFDSALFFYKKSIDLNLKRKDFSELSDAYIYIGAFFLKSTLEYDKAIKNFKYSLLYSKKINDGSKSASALNNLGETYLLKKDLNSAAASLLQAFSSLKINLNNNILNNSTTQKLNVIEDKDLLIDLMINKTLLHLNQFKKPHDSSFIDTFLKTALLTDSIITETRHQQVADKSKLYWRIKTKNFFNATIEACYLANKPGAAFLFMEKSRAVLLNDKLDELNATSFLHKTDATKQEEYEIKIIELQQKLSLLTDSSKHYQTLLLQLLNTKSDYQHFIKSLEQNYPAYYQLKYDDEVPSLKDLQQYLAKNNQSFVHYFFGDTASYILAITANKTNFIRLSQKEFNKNQLADFIRFCSNKQALNNHYDSFAALSNAIYTKIFQPLYLPKGRVVICTENTVIPFDALCKDKNGKNFLLNDYSFDYVYSARFLMKQFKNAPAHGNFIGYAPVSFAKSLHAADLKNAAEALQASADYYKNDKLYTLQTASRNNFFNYAANYSVVNIFSHARADTTDNEPVLFMQDSLIHLSELQRLTNPATQLVLLSACQTNVGKAATGEGIYSLARGFATAGIPSVSATLWKADEQSVYSISQTFNQYLSEGMTKDEALQKAKLYYFQNHSSDESFPYYWANMILIGNADALKLANNSSNNYVWIISIIAIVLIVATVISIRKKSFK